MGGKALKHTYTRRYKREEFYNLIDEIKPKLEDLFGEIDIVYSYDNKEDFGDLDVLVKGKHTKEYILNKLKTLNYSDIFINSHMYSFDYKELQIDLIFTKERFWKSSKLFFRYGDLGNFVGKIYNKMDMKYSIEGLKYNVFTKKEGKTESYLIDSIHISDEGKDIFNFIDLSWDRYMEGFKTQEDVFDYIISSKYFDAEKYLLKNLSKANRDRNKRRKGYLEFLEYIENKTFDKSEPKPSVEEISKYFNINLQEEIDKVVQNHETVKKINRKFNGKLVMEWANIDKKKGKLVGRLKNLYIQSKDDYKNFILNSSEEEIEKDFKAFTLNLNIL